MSLANMNTVFTLKNNNLYLGNIRSSVHNMRAVVSVIETKITLPECHHKWIPAEDTHDFKLNRHFDEAADFIHQHLQYGNVLVHCYAGVSRSASIVIAYLIKYHGLTLQNAQRTVQTHRSIINPNPGFLRQLKEYEHKQRNVKTYLQDMTSPRIQSPKLQRSFLSKNLKAAY